MDSQHPDRQANLEVCIETWLTEEEYREAKENHRLAWQDSSKSPSEPATPVVEVCICTSIYLSAYRRLASDSTFISSKGRQRSSLAKHGFWSPYTSRFASLDPSKTEWFPSITDRWCYASHTFPIGIRVVETYSVGPQTIFPLPRTRQLYVRFS